MRRKRTAPFHPVSRRSGVSASVMQTNRNVQTPVSLVRSLSGFGLRCPVVAAHTSHPNGPSDAANAKGFRTKRSARFDSNASVILFQIHPAVQARNLIGVAVEHE